MYDAMSRVRYGMITTLIYCTMLYDVLDAIRHSDSVRYGTVSTLRYGSQSAARFVVVKRCDICCVKYFAIGRYATLETIVRYDAKQ